MSHTSPWPGAWRIAGAGLVLFFGWLALYGVLILPLAADALAARWLFWLPLLGGWLALLAVGTLGGAARRAWLLAGLLVAALFAGYWVLLSMLRAL